MTTVPAGAAISLDLIGRIVGRKLTKQQRANASSLVLTLNRYGAGIESAAFRSDREVWGPTPAQKRYDTRADLGNTPQVDGDGGCAPARGLCSSPAVLTSANSPNGRGRRSNRPRPISTLILS